MEVAPYEVFRIEKHEGSSVISIPHETNVDELPQEMIEHRSLPFDKKENDTLRKAALLVMTAVAMLSSTEMARQTERNGHPMRRLCSDGDDGAGTGEANDAVML
ncbi:hypothetical protein Ahy_B04g071867 [Arachis hypogaea]|uniref:Uncharacterized protein n=1 Tax=Arachis hypogaea TaxID=3818 RepID=A0A444ZLS8_ARAHY|nr:hypothetical protein Ahy_B04g071867 [Arachis hypogaea]